MSNSVVSAVSDILNPSPEVSDGSNAPDPLEKNGDPVSQDEQDNLDEEGNLIIDGELDDDQIDDDQVDPDNPDGSDNSEEDDFEFNVNDDFNVAQLSEAIGLEPEELYNMQISLSDDADPVRLGDIKDTFQSMNRENDTLQAKVTEQAQLIEQGKQGFNEQNTLNQGVMQVQGALAALDQQFAAVNWPEEERLDPGNAALMRQKFQEQANKIQKQGQLLDQKQKDRSATYFAEQKKKMYDIIPQWKDQAVEKTDKAQMRTTLNAFGFTDQIINSVNDPLLLKLALEYTQLVAANKAAKIEVNKVKKAPKMIRGRGKVPARKTQARDKAVSRAHRTGKKGDELNAVKHILSQGSAKAR